MINQTSRIPTKEAYLETYLNGWKEIAQYLKRGIRTVQRWEALYGMPVTRPAGRDRSAVVANTALLDAWLGTASKEALDLDEIPEAKQVTVLTVDDNEAFRYAIQKTISQQGFSVAVASNGDEALHLSIELQPSVIIMDVNMPGLNGFDVCRRLKADPRTSSIPVIFLSSTARNASALDRGIAAGGEAFLFAPIDSTQLSAVILGAVLKARRDSPQGKRASHS